MRMHFRAEVAISQTETVADRLQSIKDCRTQNFEGDHLMQHFNKFKENCWKYSIKTNFRCLRTFEVQHELNS